MPQDEASVRQVWSTLVTQSWNDEQLRTRLLEEPAAVLGEHGVTVPDGATLKTFENDGNAIILPVARRPADTELSDEDLDSVSGGVLSLLGSSTSLKSFGSFSGPKIGGKDDDGLGLNTEPIA